MTEKRKPANDAPDERGSSVSPAEEAEKLRTELEAKTRELERLEQKVERQQAMLDNVLNSKAWKLATKLRGLRAKLRFFPALISGAGQRTIIDQQQYQQWIERRERPASDPAKLQAALSTFAYTPTISIVTPVYNTPRDFLEKAIRSVEAQVYPEWELCICDDASTAVHIRPFLEECARRNPRIRVAFDEQNGWISQASNAALRLATGEFVGFLDHDDELSPDALFWAVELLQRHRAADIIYSDEDKLETNGQRSDPFFKPDWSPEFLLSAMYTCHFAVYRRELLEAIGGFRVGFEGSQDYDLMLRATERTQKVFHVPRVLYHWRKTAGSTAASSLAKSGSSDAGVRALMEHLQRRGVPARVETVRPNRYRVRPALQGEPLVSIIIPTKDRLRLLQRCVASIERKTTYRHYEILIVDNDSQHRATKEYLSGSRHRVLAFPEPFNFPRLNNFADREAHGKYLVLLNNDTTVISPDWLQAMLEVCRLPGMAVVGAKLYYPNHTIQHAGIVLGIGGVAGHGFRRFPGRHRGYFDSLVTIRNVSAVTAACMMVQRDVYERVGGMDEKLKVAYNDVDFCLRVVDAGYRVAWTPYAELYHWESATRSHDVDPQELAYAEARWGERLVQDPYYNPNLSLARFDYGLRL